MKIIFLSFLCFAVLFFNSCSQATSKPKNENGDQSVQSQSEKSKDYGEAKQIAMLEDKDINESSGIVASRTNANTFWTHNDSGGGNFIYAFDAKGKRRGVWRVTGAENVDWEDIAISKSHIYIGDIGDNGEKRESIIVYRVAEPTIKKEDATSSKSKPLQTAKAEAIRLQYPDGKHDAETLLVHPATNDIYVITKTMKGAAGVYKISNPSTSAMNKLVKVGDVNVPSMMKGFLTGGDISPDGLLVILCDYFASFEFTTSNNTKFDNIWQSKPLVVSLGQRQQGESVCYAANGKAIYATSEKTPTPLIEVKRIK
jgi:hypothetical protein